MNILNNKFLQRFLAFGPFLLFFLLIAIYVGFLLFMISNFSHNGIDDDFEPTPFDVGVGGGFFIFIIFLTMIVSLLSQVFYIIHVLKNNRLKEGNAQILWVLLMIFFSGLAQIIYFFVEIMGKPPIDLSGDKISERIY